MAEPHRGKRSSLTEKRRETLLAAGGLIAEGLEVHTESLACELRTAKTTARRRLGELVALGWAELDGGWSSCGWFKTYKVTERGWDVLWPIIRTM